MIRFVETNLSLITKAPRQTPRLKAPLFSIVHLFSLWTVIQLAAACMDPIPPDTLTGQEKGTISGTVKDGCKNSGLMDVDVSLRPYDAQTGTSSQATPPAYHTGTDASGRFQIEDVPAGLWQLNFQKKDFQATEKIIQVLSGGQVDIPPISLISSADLISDSVKKMDILFVVDNSNSMAEEQEMLALAFPAFINTLKPFSFFLDLHIGVISTDLGAGGYNIPSCLAPNGDGGKLQNSPRKDGCSPPKDPYIAIAEDKNGITTNVANDLITEAFSCIALLGVEGCGFEQPLASILQALDSTNNPNFMRDDALLGIIVLSDEDDCSATSPALFDPAQITTLGPLNSFRCFKFGTTCECMDGKSCAAETAGQRQNCQPSDDGQLITVDAFYSKLTAIYPENKIFFSVIAGPNQNTTIGIAGDGYPTLLPSCITTSGSATPAIRLQAVANRFAPNSSYETICISTLGQTLTNIAKEMAKQALVSSCAE